MAPGWGGARDGSWKLEFYVCKGSPLLPLLVGALRARGYIVHTVGRCVSMASA